MFYPPKWQNVLLTILLCIAYLIGRYMHNTDILYVVILFVLGYFVICLILSTEKNSSHVRAENFDTQEHASICTGNSTHSCGQNGNLLPILEPEFNLRECTKQIILLEDHLANPRKRCDDCIKKHCLTIEALAEEGNALDKNGSCRDDCNRVAESMRKVEEELLSGKDPAELAQELRQIRKPLMQKYFNLNKL